MKTERKYLYVLIAMLAFYVIYEMQKPKETDWTQTYHFRDKIPFGTYVIHDLIEDLFSGQQADHVFTTLYSLQEAGDTERNQLVIANQINFSDQDLEGLINYVESGRTVMLSAVSLEGELSDSLGFEMGFEEQIFTTDLSAVQLALTGGRKNKVSLELPGTATQTFDFPAIAVSGYFMLYNEEKWEALAFNDSGSPVLLRSKQMAGDLYLSSMPMAFTNYFVLDEETSAFASSLLSLFPEYEPLTHNEYYQLGRMEPTSKIRFFLRHESLTWAMYLLILTVLLFMLFEAKRRQRIIPVVRPLKNSTLEFVNVLGRLHYRQSDHARLAEKRLLYWKDFVRNHYNMRTDHLDETFVEELEKKSGRRKNVIASIVELATQVFEQKHLSEGELMTLEKLLNEFYDIK